MLIKKKEDMLSNVQSVIFIHEFLRRFGEYTILADYDESGKLIVFVNPYADFDALVAYICENIFEIFSYTASLEIALYPFGSNTHVKLSLNSTNGR
ncbi:MAG: hypothetical protein EOO90_09765 [Pedobacter sp.]|nr:MAG: hypothetical protein EOO90_09765 [Pedobacter sp.]